MNSNFEKQKSAYKKLSELKAGALFMEAGTGKTKVAIDLINSRRDFFDKVIWICPACLLREKSYLNEIEKWQCEKDILFFTIESISQSEIKYLELVKKAKEINNFCVIDESLYIKNTDSKRVRRLLFNYKIFNYRLILNGTPTSKGLIDLYSQMNFLHPKIFNMTEQEFANKFLIYKKEGYKPYKKWSKPYNEEALMEYIKPYIFDSELELGIKIKNKDIYCQLNEKEKNNYESIKDKTLKQKDINDLNFLEITQKFQHTYTINKDKIKKLKEIIKKGEKYLIFVKYLKEFDILEKHFDIIKLNSKEKVKNIQDKFKKKTIFWFQHMVAVVWV
jgi:SNF2 family DNA or RNA helicase